MSTTTTKKFRSVRDVMLSYVVGDLDRTFVLSLYVACSEHLPAANAVADVRNKDMESILEECYSEGERNSSTLLAEAIAECYSDAQFVQLANEVLAELRK